MDLYDNKAAERAEVYKLFSALLMKEPTPEIVQEVKELFRIESDEPFEAISGDFAAIFLRPDLHMAPYESLYNVPLGDKPALWGKAAIETQAFYESSGLVLDESIDLVPDHLAIELLFMSYLIENGRVEEQRKFLEEHLFLWMPSYCEGIQKHAGTVFFKDVANLMKEFIMSEYELMNE